MKTCTWQVHRCFLKILKTDDPDFVKIAEETEEECIKMFVDAVDQEKLWAEYLFKDGSMIGLNTQLLNEYIEWIATRRMQYVGLNSPYNIKIIRFLGHRSGSVAQKSKLLRKKQKLLLI
jgi:Ribonucleotide reductase, beta subunit